MKKFLLSIAILAISAGTLFAQESSAERLRWMGVMNNGFWSNWEIHVGGGINATAWNGIGADQKTTDRIAGSSKYSHIKHIGTEWEYGCRQKCTYEQPEKSQSFKPLHTISFYSGRIRSQGSNTLPPARRL